MEGSAQDIDVEQLKTRLVELCLPMLREHGALFHVRRALEAVARDLKRECTANGWTPN
jgi:hypothetical protein